MLVEELNGEALNDAAYQRQLQIESDLNCALDQFLGSGDTNAGRTEFSKPVLAGESLYDIGLMRGTQYTKLVTDGILTELTDIPNVDYSNPWWDADYMTAMAIGGKNYGIVSDITMNGYLSTFCIYFNKDLVADYNMDDPYGLVNDGKWTLDTMYSMAKLAAKDLDGDGVTTNADQLGFSYIDDVPQALLNAGGVRMGDLDENGIPRVTIISDANLTKMQHLYDLLSDTETSYNCHARSTDSNSDEAGMFVRGQVLFNVGGIYYGPEMRQMDGEFGIIPLPKYNEAQSDYNMPTLAICMTYACVPVSNGDLENTGIFMEYFAYLGRRDLLPQFYEINLQHKVARDNDSEGMLRLIFDNRFYDSGLIFDLGGASTAIRVMYHNLQPDFASKIESLSGKIQSDIDKLAESIAQ